MVVQVWLTVAGCPLRETITRDVTAAVTKLGGVSAVRVELDVMSEEQRRALQSTLRGGTAEKEIPFSKPGSLTKVFAIASGKGGVGKSSVTVNLAVAMAAAGLRVGLLDADIYGHSVPRMLGVTAGHPGRADDHAAVRARGRRHLQRHAQEGQRAAAAARPDPAPAAAAVPGRRVLGRPGCAADGPAAGHGRCGHFRCAPGAGQRAGRRDDASAGLVRGGRAGWIAGGPAAPADRRRIENMSYLPCPHCGERVEVFGAGGGQAVADTLTRLTGAPVPLLGEVPIDTRLREAGDIGVPLVLSDPDSPAAQQLRKIAENLGGRSRSLAGRQLGLTPV